MYDLIGRRIFLEELVRLEVWGNTRTVEDVVPTSANYPRSYQVSHQDWPHPTNVPFLGSSKGGVSIRTITAMNVIDTDVCKY